jgi:D-3-phosphoglycerate dehydrogenase
MKILVSDSLSEKGLEILRKEPDIEVFVKTGLSGEELIKEIPSYDALIVRSATKVTADVIKAGTSLKVIGRAGVGLDNVNIQAATEKGIIVMNSPGGNIISTAEHTIALLFALARHVSPAHQSMQKGIWEKKKYTGVEINGKTLGVIGLGRVGLEVSRRAKGIGMKVLAYDPFISRDKAHAFGIELVDLKDIYSQAHFITIHTPLTNETRNMIDAKAISLMRDGVRIINCARGGIVDEKALYEALKSKKVAGAALDVFEKEPLQDSPLLGLDNVVLTPHLAASTLEGQENVALEIAQEVLDALKGRILRNAVNVPSVDPEVYEVLRPYINFAEKLGLLQAQLSSGRVKTVNIGYSGEVIKHDLTPVTVALLKGLLEPILKETVNYVNASLIAQERDIKVSETKMTQASEFANLMEVTVERDTGISRVAGAVFSRHASRLVHIDDFHVDVLVHGNMLICSHVDKPGVVGKIGTILGRHNINIAAMSLGRAKRGGRELTVLNVDSPLTPGVLRSLKKIKEMKEIRVVKL